LADLSIDSRRGPAHTNRADTLPVDGDGNAAFDADKPAGTNGECLRQHLMVGNLAAVTSYFSRSGGRERGGASFGLSDQCVVCSAVGHAFERHQVTAGVDDANADDLFEFFGLFDGRVDDYIAALLAEFEKWHGFHIFPLRDVNVQ
jgi:hypothetical protein